MNPVERLRDYAIKCGLPKDIRVDEHTLILSRSTKTIHDIVLNDGESLDDYTNLDSPHKIESTKSVSGYNVYDTYGGVFVVQPNGRLSMFAPIYECHGSVAKGSIVSITGFEQVAVLNFHDLKESFSHSTS